MSRSLDLIYSTHIGFFGRVQTIHEIVLKFKSKEVINDFSDKDKTEVMRGNSYAVFPELDIDKSGRPITLDALRTGLENRGIKDKFLQNKVLCMLVQEKAGLQFSLGSLVSGFLMENGHCFSMRQDYKLSLNVKNEEHIELIFSGIWQDLDELRCNESKDNLAASIKVDITPDRVAINSFKITQLSDGPGTVRAFNFLQANQASLWQKIVIFFKTLFNANADIQIENVAVDKQPWHENTKKYEEDDHESDISSLNT